MNCPFRQQPCSTECALAIRDKCSIWILADRMNDIAEELSSIGEDVSEIKGRSLTHPSDFVNVQADPTTLNQWWNEICQLKPVGRLLLPRTESEQRETPILNSQGTVDEPSISAPSNSQR